MVNSETYAFKPDYSVHPGEYLEEVLASRDIKKRELSERLGISVKHLSQIVNKQALLNSDLAVAMERTLGISANIWNNMSADYSLFEARIKEAEEIKRQIKWMKQFPLKNLVQYGFLPKVKEAKIMFEKLLEFFGVPNPEQWKKYYKLKSVQFRHSPTYNKDLPHLTAWLRAGEIISSRQDTAAFDKETFKKNLSEIRNFTLANPNQFEEKMKCCCAESGVALVFLPEFDKTHISGATKWLTPEKAMIIMSLRHKTNDHFWFTFFHEAAHILLHGKKDVYIDDSKGFHSKEEEDANRFARNILIPENEYNMFVSIEDFSKINILRFARSLDIHPGIVVGFLQHDEHLRYEWHNQLKDRFEIIFNREGSSNRN